jgi:hypothetical protein
MGDHKTNPRAIAAAQAPVMPPGSVVIGFQFQAVLELNAAKMAEVSKELDFATAAGKDPATVITPELNPKEHPEWYDYVVYNVPTIGRPSVLMQNVPTARVRWSEHLRVPYKQLLERADGLFNGAAMERMGVQ